MAQLTFVASEHNNTNSVFTLDDMRDILASKSQISSNGASGALAVAKSTRADRSRDPLYNQVKMMSELYRMFGWIRSVPGNRLEFRMTHLGLTLTLDAPSFGQASRNALIAESLVSVVFPNETTTNVGVTNLRPFAWLLRLMLAMDCFITRDEMIVGLLAITNDKEEGLFERTVSRLQQARASGETRLMANRLAVESNIQVNTLQNYTRLPIGALTSTILNWATVKTINTSANSPATRGFELTSEGKKFAKDVAARYDLRLSSLLQFSSEIRASIADFGYYEMLRNSNFTLETLNPELIEIEKTVRPTLSHLGCSRDQRLLFNPELQEQEHILDLLAE